MRPRPHPFTALSTKANKLAVLLDALGGVAISDGERASLAWLADSRRTPWRTSPQWSPAPDRPASRHARFAHYR
jgi:hypothetical protein